MERKIFVIFSILLSIFAKAQNCTVTITGTNSICYQSSTTLTASGASNYTWSPSSGLSSNTGSVVTASPSVTTQYTITASTGTCVANNTFTLYVQPLPAVSLSPPSSTGCATLCVTFTNTAATLVWYYWNWGDGQMNIDTHFVDISGTHCYTLPGTYTCTLTVDNHVCTNSATAIITVNLCSGITAFDIANQLKIFPNPSAGRFNLTIKDFHFEKIKVNITNTLNEIVYSTVIEDESADFGKQINLTGIPDGTYFIQVQIGEKITVKKLILQQ